MNSLRPSLLQNRAALAGVWFVVSLAALGGCPAVPPAESGAGAGHVWVEYAGGELFRYELPDVRGEPGIGVRTVEPAPAWYTGPGVYASEEDGGWTRLTSDPALTLDDVLQVYDPPPATR